MTEWQFVSLLGAALLSWPVIATARRYKRIQRTIKALDAVDLNVHHKPRIRILRDGWIRHQGGPFPFDPRCQVEVILFNGAHFSDPETADRTPEQWWRGQAARAGHDVEFYRIVAGPEPRSRWE